MTRCQVKCGLKDLKSRPEVLALCHAEAAPDNWVIPLSVSKRISWAVTLIDCEFRLCCGAVRCSEDMENICRAAVFACRLFCMFFGLCMRSSGVSVLELQFLDPSVCRGEEEGWTEFGRLALLLTFTLNP